MVELHEELQPNSRHWGSSQGNRPGWLELLKLAPVDACGTVRHNEQDCGVNMLSIYTCDSWLWLWHYTLYMNLLPEYNIFKSCTWCFRLHSICWKLGCGKSTSAGLLGPACIWTILSILMPKCLQYLRLARCGIILMMLTWECSMWRVFADMQVHCGIIRFLLGRMPRDILACLHHGYMQCILMQFLRHNDIVIYICIYNIY